ncbi:MAG: OmpH family outer membrane protein [Bacteroidetes bacterium]|jgi:Skp family chaperone for outer membrane proteins|nr:OmpH family outer membrane protein [Bacteroidota bacterium]
MNRLVAALLVALALWCIGLTWVVVKNPSEALSPELQMGETPVIAFVHGDSIQSGYAFIAAQEQKLFKAVQEAQSAIELESGPLQSEAQELIEYGNSGAANAEEIQMVQRRLGEIESQLMQMQQTGTNRLAEMEAMLQAEVTKKLTDEVMAFAVERNIGLVLNWGQSGEGVLYGAMGWDVTDPLLEFINGRLPVVEVESSETL